MLPISVCVPATRGATVPYLVEAVLRQSYRCWELILVTQGSDFAAANAQLRHGDPTVLGVVEKAVASDERIRSVHIERFGKSRALNAGVKLATGEAVAFTDDDCEPDPDWLQVIADCFEKESRVGLLGGDLIPTKCSPFRVSTCPATFTIETVYRPAELGYSAPPGFNSGGANWAARRSTLELIGRFDEYLGPGTIFATGEDTDYGLRCEALGIWMQTTPGLRVRHTFGRRFGLRAVMKHHRGYALGQGALCGKLALWGHRLARLWNGKMTLTDRARALRTPSHFLRETYKQRYWRQGRDQYLDQYELGDDMLSHPKVLHARQGSSIVAG